MNKKNLSLAIISILILAGCGKAQPQEPFSYSTKGVNVQLTKSLKPFGYTAKNLQDMAIECETQHPAGYFENLVKEFEGASRIVYNFKYVGDSQKPDTFVVTLLPNTKKYSSVEEFKKDFDVCGAGAQEYPKLVNPQWLMFVSSCGSGFSDNSGKPVGCDEVKKVVEPSLKFN